MNHFDVETLPVSPWRNGGGETREIASGPAGSEGPAPAAAWGWRASIATIAQDGPFSVFPGVDRSITLLSGDGVRLVGEGGVDHLLVRAGEPFAFPGDIALGATLTGGSSRDFNIMTRRGGWAADVRRVTGPATPPPGHAGVFYVLQGTWSYDGTVLAAGHGVWWPHDSAHSPATAAPASPDAAALWADIRPAPDAGPAEG
ncbi:HutD/Ves family protein [Yinghuangia soli]|uniref:HutD family protein n=1 Tax=Yinghuangia soli TaxID=2908204 RepID=A0AA41Q8M0_9ACTN|nr:HutD family protein [Yinghuangia soli]MCF2533231.1 HutD family protein [Yinghuangia soli]